MSEYDRERAAARRSCGNGMVGLGDGHTWKALLELQKCPPLKHAHEHILETYAVAPLTRHARITA